MLKNLWFDVKIATTRFDPNLTFLLEYDFRETLKSLIEITFGDFYIQMAFGHLYYTYFHVSDLRSSYTRKSHNFHWKHVKTCENCGLVSNFDIFTRILALFFRWVSLNFCVAPVRANFRGPPQMGSLHFSKPKILIIWVKSVILVIIFKDFWPKLTEFYKK